jgi:hypothetical protein
MAFAGTRLGAYLTTKGNEVWVSGAYPVKVAGGWFLPAERL